MRYRAASRHARHRPGPSGRTYFITLLAALSALAAALALTDAPPAARAQAAPAAVTQARDTGQGASEPGLPQVRARLDAARASLAASRVRAALAAAIYTVRGGDSLSQVAQARCGAARDWTGIYAASRARHWTAVNANILATGQHLFLACAWQPSMLRFAPAPPPLPAPATTLRSSTTLTSTNVRTPAHSTRSATSTTYRASSRAASAVYHGAGTYSFAGLEALWESAGGPAWAASHAAEIAECESGGRTSAYNPSGATGLWQILGSVVPGNLYNAFTNALNAVSKFRASGDTFAQWVCR